MSVKFFLITLDSRREISERNAALINDVIGEAVILSGYDPSLISVQEFNEYSGKFHARYGVKPLLNQLACLRAHRNAMLEFLKTPDDFCVIGEDDFRLLDTNRIAEELETYVPNSGQVINFGGFQGLPVEKMRVIDSEGFVPASKLRFIHMMALYCIDREFAEKYVTNIEGIGLNNDDWHGLNAEAMYRSLKLVPSIFHGDEKSILDPKSDRGYQTKLLDLKIIAHNFLNPRLHTPHVMG